MIKSLSIGLLLLPFVLPAAVRSQAIPTATRSRSLQVGGGFSFASPDYGGSYIMGITGYTDLDLPHRFGAELDLHFMNIFTPTDIGESTFLIGPRYSILSQHRLNAYIKALGGFGRFAYQQGTYPNPHTDTYGVFSIGGGVEFRASDHINVRAIDFEAQRWPGYADHGLSPFVTTFGVAYVR